MSYSQIEKTIEMLNALHVEPNQPKEIKNQIKLELERQEENLRDIRRSLFGKTSQFV